MIDYFDNYLQARVKVSVMEVLVPVVKQTN